MFEGQGVMVDYTIDYSQLSRSLLTNYQLFLCLRDGMIWPTGYLGPDAYTSYEQGLENRDDFPEANAQNWLTEEQASAIKEFVTAGNGFYSLHNNSHVSLSSPTYRDVMGGVYIGHPPLRPFNVRVVNSSHPITQGIADFVVTDEQHYVHYDKDHKYILLEAEKSRWLELPESRSEIGRRLGLRLWARQSRLHIPWAYHSRFVGSGIFQTSEESSAMAAEGDLGLKGSTVRHAVGAALL